MIHDLKSYKKYKEAITILPHLEAILKVLNLTEKALSFYNSYLPVAKILYTLKEQKLILELYKEQYSKLKNSKGIKNE